MEKNKISSLLAAARLSIVISNTANALPTTENNVLQSNQKLLNNLDILSENDSYRALLLAGSNYGCGNNGGCHGQESCRRV